MLTRVFRLPRHPGLMHVAPDWHGRGRIAISSFSAAAHLVDSVLQTISVQRQRTINVRPGHTLCP